VSEQKRYLATGLLPLHTPRLRLRVMRKAEAQFQADYRSDPAVAEYQFWDLPYTIERSLAQLAGPDEPEGLVVGGTTTLAVVLAETGEVIGDLAVSIDRTGLTAEVGFTLIPRHQGKGYAREGTEALVDLLFDQPGMVRISGELDPLNIASARVLEAVGLEHEADTKQSFWWRGHWADNRTYGVTATDYRRWRTRPQAPPGLVELVPLTNANYRDFASLATHYTQLRFTPTVLEMFAEVHFGNSSDGALQLRGIEAGGEPVGLLVVAEAAGGESPALHRLLIDRRHQGRGIGRRTVEQIADRLRREGHSALTARWTPGRGGPRGFFEKLGFVVAPGRVDPVTQGTLDLR